MSNWIWTSCNQGRVKGKWKCKSKETHLPRAESSVPRVPHPSPNQWGPPLSLVRSCGDQGIKLERSYCLTVNTLPSVIAVWFTSEYFAVLFYRFFFFQGLGNWAMNDGRPFKFIKHITHYTLHTTYYTLHTTHYTVKFPYLGKSFEEFYLARLLLWVSLQRTYGLLVTCQVVPD